jgi:uncharacterized protein (DUF736 family)
MAIIATMKKLENGTIEGKVKTAILNFHLRLHPIEGAGDDKKPDYRAKVSGYEAGAGWKKISEQNNPYVSVQLDDPALPAPIHANLIEKEGEYLLLWSRKD